jgi:hypothetical protein
MSEEECRSGPGDELAFQAVIDKIDCHDKLRNKAEQALGKDWKKASLPELRKFLVANAIKE